MFDALPPPGYTASVSISHHRFQQQQQHHQQRPHRHQHHFPDSSFNYIMTAPSDAQIQQQQQQQHMPPYCADGASFAAQQFHQQPYQQAAFVNAPCLRDEGYDNVYSNRNTQPHTASNSPNTATLQQPQTYLQQGYALASAANCMQQQNQQPPLLPPCQQDGAFSETYVITDDEDGSTMDTAVDNLPQTAYQSQQTDAAQNVCSSFDPFHESFNQLNHPVADAQRDATSSDAANDADDSAGYLPCNTNKQMEEERIHTEFIRGISSEYSSDHDDDDVDVDDSSETRTTEDEAVGIAYALPRPANCQQRIAFPLGHQLVQPNNVAPNVVEVGHGTSEAHDDSLSQASFQVNAPSTTAQSDLATSSWPDYLSPSRRSHPLSRSSSGGPHVLSPQRARNLSARAIGKMLSVTRSFTAADVANCIVLDNEVDDPLPLQQLSLRIQHHLATTSPRVMVFGLMLLVEQAMDRMSTEPDPFDASYPLTSPLHTFAMDLLRCEMCSKECLPLAVTFLFKLRASRDLKLTPRNIHRSLLVAIMLASKVIDDRYCRNSAYATFGNVSLGKLNQLELHFSSLLDFDFTLPLDCVFACLSRAQRAVAAAPSEKQAALALFCTQGAMPTLSATAPVLLTPSPAMQPSPFPISAGLPHAVTNSMAAVSLVQQEPVRASNNSYPTIMPGQPFLAFPSSSVNMYPPSVQQHFPGDMRAPSQFATGLPPPPFSLAQAPFPLYDPLPPHPAPLLQQPSHHYLPPHSLPPQPYASHHAQQQTPVFSCAPPHFVQQQPPCIQQPFARAPQQQGLPHQHFPHRASSDLAAHRSFESTSHSAPRTSEAGSLNSCNSLQETSSEEVARDDAPLTHESDDFQQAEESSPSKASYASVAAMLAKPAVSRSGSIRAKAIPQGKAPRQSRGSTYVSKHQKQQQLNKQLKKHQQMNLSQQQLRALSQPAELLVAPPTSSTSSFTRVPPSAHCTHRMSSSQHLQHDTQSQPKSCCQQCELELRQASSSSPSALLGFGMPQPLGNFAAPGQLQPSRLNPLFGLSTTNLLAQNVC